MTTNGVKHLYEALLIMRGMGHDSADHDSRDEADRPSLPPWHVGGGR